MLLNPLLLRTGGCIYCRLSRRVVSQISQLGQSFNFKLQAVQRLDPRGQSQGRYDVPALSTANGWQDLTRSAYKQAANLRAEVLNETRSRKLVEVFDELSNAICCVADMAECVRQIDPEQDMAEAAEQCLLSMHQLVEELNTDYDLYAKLKSCLENGDKWPLTDVERLVIQLFVADFEISGVMLKDEQRQRFVDLTQLILIEGTAFARGTDRPTIYPKRLCPPSLVPKFSTNDELIIVDSAKNGSPDPDVREWGYRLYYLPNDSQERHLTALLQHRQELAELCGFPSFAHRALSRIGLMQTPEQAVNFLEQLASELKPRADDDFEAMRAFYSLDNPGREFCVWDVPYYASVLRNEQYGVSDAKLNPYLSLGTVLDGLSGLLHSLYDVQLTLVPTKPGEVWHESVQKMAIVHASEGLLGHVYLDLFARPGKMSECHFTIRGGRAQPPPSQSPYQNPIVTLALSFPPPTPSSPSFLSIYQVENLFHEMGHAMHTMLGRTQFQHVTGTRCPTDFAEVPSNLMEYLVYDPRVLSEVAVHHSTSQPLAQTSVEAVCKSWSSLLASELQQQILYALFDLRLHLQTPSGHTRDLFQEVHEQVYGLPFVPNTAWHHRFSHLVVYGAKYYSYVAAKATAALLWQHAFKADPYSRETGTRFRNEVLKFGGERPPWTLIQRFLGWTPSTQHLIQALLAEVDQNKAETTLGVKDI